MDKILLLIKKAFKSAKEQGLAAAFGRTKRKIIRIFRLENRFKPMDVLEVVYDLQHNTRPLYTVSAETDRKRLNIVIDGIDRGSLSGKAATALIIGSKIAAKNNMDLRIITREAHVNPGAYLEFIKYQGIEKPGNVGFYSDFDRVKDRNLLKLEVSENDIFIATSWWTAHVMGQICFDKRFFYLMQEPELMSCTDNDERLLCGRVLEKENIDFIVNSRVLFDYFKDIKADNIIKNGCFFEPAFPESLFKPGKGSFAKKDRYKLFFYGSTDNPGNLYKTGLKCLDDAVNAGIIDIDKWDIIIAGSGIEPFVFSNGMKPVLKGRMPWKEYSEFASTVDLAFCPMYPPHPGYPALDMAASGAVVLTNKPSAGYSENIITCGLEKIPMLEGFNKAVALALNGAKREANCKKNNICRSWDTAVGPADKFIMEKIKKIKHV